MRVDGLTERRRCIAQHADALFTDATKTTHECSWSHENWFSPTTTLIFALENAYPLKVGDNRFSLLEYKRV